MTGIARFVQDKDLKKILRATDGLGTEATRAGIIELLFKRGFLSKRALYPFLGGRQGAHSFPAGDGRATGHDRHWESVLTQISEKQCRYQDFMRPLVGTLYQRSIRRAARRCVVPRPWRRAGRRSRSAKVKGSRKAKAADDTAPPPHPPVVARMRYPAATASPPVRPMVYTNSRKSRTRGPERDARCAS